MSPELLKACSKYMPVPYLDKGRDLAGWDCYGLYRWVLQERHGITIPSYVAEYASAEEEVSVSSALGHRADASWQMVPAGSEQEGDGIVFRIAGEPRHCGYVLEPGIMLHSMRGRGTCVERYNLQHWIKRIEGIYRWNS